MVDIFDEATGQTIQQKVEEEDDEQEELIDEIARKEFRTFALLFLQPHQATKPFSTLGKKVEPLMCIVWMKLLPKVT